MRLHWLRQGKALGEARKAAHNAPAPYQAPAHDRQYQSRNDRYRQYDGCYLYGTKPGQSLRTGRFTLKKP